MVFPSRQPFKLGRKRPIVRRPRLHFVNYLLRTLPLPPPTIDYTDRAKNPLLTDVLKNDDYGDCTCAAAYHIAGTLLANASAPYGTTVDPLLNDENCLAFYMKLTGGQDNGLDEQTVLDAWHTQGLLPGGLHKIVGYVGINPMDVTEVQSALWLMENLYFGVELPDPWIDPMPDKDGFSWDSNGAPNPESGHAFCGVGYDKQGVQINTWGLIGTITWQAISEYASAQNGGQLFAVLSHDAINVATQKAPNGFNWSQLQADLQAFS